MRITKYTHACVRLERDGRVLVIDPGIWSEPEALIGADAVLVTHEHTDHVDRLRLAGLGVPVFAPAGARIAAVGIREVNAGETFDAAGFTVTTVGGEHAPVYDAPSCANVGYVVDDELYHPGDALYVPDQPVDTLLMPVHASWMKVAEAIEFARAVGARRVFGIHEGGLNDRGAANADKWFSQHIPGFHWLPPASTA